MGESAHKAILFVSALALAVIAVQFIPFSRDKELSNLCREYYAITKAKGLPINEDSVNPKLASTINVIATKTGLTGLQTIHNYCHSFYLNQ